MQASERERPAKGRGRRRYLLTDKIEYNAAVADAGPIDASIGDGRGRASSANSLHCSIQNFWTVTKQCSRRREALADGVPARGSVCNVLFQHWPRWRERKAQAAPYATD